jgi:hypothetical protein
VDGKYSVRKVLAGRRIEASEFLELLQKGTLGLVEGFRSRLGSAFLRGVEAGGGKKD